MSTKAALKRAKASLDSADYDSAIRNAETVLSSDSQNYFARLFLGRAYEKQGKVEDAAKAYEAAANSKPEDTQAWLGLCSLYEAQGAKYVDEYRVAAVKAAELFASADDLHRCQTTVDKLVSFAKQNGTKAQYKRALEVLLPSSSLYEALEGRVPHPSHTYVRLAEITEGEEAQTMKQEIASRRSRLGSRLNQVTMEVKREVYGRSNLEHVYQEIINWSSDDEVRRKYEEKLLERAYDMLIVSPADQKASKLDQVLDLAEGMVTIHHPFQLAWDLVLETRDLDDLKDLDVNILREYTVMFPDVGAAKILQSWLTSELSPFPPAKDAEGEDDKPMSSEERLLLMTEGLSAAEQSPFAYRLVGDYYLHLEEHESAAEAARSGLKVIADQSARLGMTLQNTRDAINSVLATAFVHFEAPRNHAQARKIFENILDRKPNWTPALIGLGLIFEENEEYQNATAFLSRALDLDKSNIRIGTELAWCTALNGDYHQAQLDLEAYLPEMRADDPRTRDLRAQVQYRIGMCMWEADSSKSARRDRNGAYSRFLTAIKTNVNFAPAYTSLGIYYSNYGKDKKRARQCFQKAFELSPAETDAAEHLARLFADQGDWDIVEVIAQRVVDTGRARPPPGSKRKGLSWPYSALGVVQMNKQDYHSAITSFLAALRISPDDYQSYVGLGESYHNSGRYNSALRTFNYALEPQDGAKLRVSGETWFAKYMLANVHRELGDYDEAIERLEQVLEDRPAEFGVLMSLLQTLAEESWRNVETGLYGQAVDSACQLITTATTVAQTHPNAFNMWKAVGDACMIFSWVQSGIDRFPTEEVRNLLAVEASTTTFDSLATVDQVTWDAFGVSNDGNGAAELSNHLTAGILAFKRAIQSCSHDVHAQAVAWYNLGWAEHRAYVCNSSKTGKKFLKAAVRCFKRAIELEAGNAEFWNALGVTTTTLNPKVAQHSFVRSLHLNELNAKVWTNLGVLYLLQNDIELAHKAFGRAQSTDPTYAHAWLGEGLYALLTGYDKEALSHFTHAFEISDSSSTITKRQYSLSVFDHLLATPSASNDLTALIQPIFALAQLQTQTLRDLPAQHLAALFFERVGNHAAAIEALTSLCSSAEAEYESSTSLAAVARFAHANADLARNQLAAGDFEAATESSTTALDLTSEADSSGLDIEARTKLRLSAHLTAGLAMFYSNRSSEAIGMFKSALHESGNDADVISLLVKVLWTHGEEEEKSVAREQLFECVENNPEHVSIVTLLGTVAALDGDEDTTSAVRTDLLALRMKDGLTIADQNEIESLLSALAALSSGNVDAAALAEAQTAMMLHPDRSLPWTELAGLTGSPYAADMALKTAKAAVASQESKIEAKELAAMFAGVGSAADSQKGIFLAPWECEGWKSLGDAVLN